MAEWRAQRRPLQFARHHRAARVQQAENQDLRLGGRPSRAAVRRRSGVPEAEGRAGARVSVCQMRHGRRSDWKVGNLATKSSLEKRWTKRVSYLSLILRSTPQGVVCWCLMISLITYSFCSCCEACCFRPCPWSSLFQRS